MNYRLALALADLCGANETLCYATSDAAERAYRTTNPDDTEASVEAAADAVNAIRDAIRALADVGPAKETASG